MSKDPLVGILRSESQLSTNEHKHISWVNDDEESSRSERRDSKAEIIAGSSGSNSWNSHTVPQIGEVENDEEQKGYDEDEDDGDSPLEVIQNIVDTTPDENLDGDEAFRKRLRMALKKADLKNAFLFYLMWDFETRPEMRIKHLRLCSYVVKIDPSLLIKSTKVESSLLHKALINLPKVPPLREFIECVCDAAISEEFPGPGGEMNYCQKEIHKQHNGLTCLHYAFEANLVVASYLLKVASCDTILTLCGTDGHTVLHIALRAAISTKARMDWKGPINDILEKTPSVLLEFDSKGQSPYPYFQQQMEIYRSKKNSPAKVKESITQQKNRNQQGNEEGKKRKTSSLSGAQTPEKASKDSKSPRNNDGRSEDKTRASKENRVLDQLTELDQLLKEKCLESGSFLDTSKALHGNIEEKPATWLNLLGVELPENYPKKLQFRKPANDMIFVGVQSPKTNRGNSSGTHIIEEFFQWLREQKVEGIMKVIVRDDPMNPCGDHIIHKSLKGFNVQYLDWNRGDISCKTLSVCPNLRKLYLYSSGNSAVLHGLADESGLKSLEKLMSVKLSVSRGWDSDDHTSTNLKDLKKVFENSKVGRTLEYSENKKDSQGPQAASHSGHSKKNHRWLKFTQEFTEGIEEYFNDLPESDVQRYPKVCIIDDGVFLDDLYTMKAGRSFGQQVNYSSNPGECFPSADGHGAHMARIIYNLCPCIHLYVGKLERTGGGGKFTMKDARKAIEWAIKENVDIISMSWTIDNGNKDDKDALKEVFRECMNMKNPPIMFCASRDQGIESQDVKIYPFDCLEKSNRDLICRIGAASEYGDALPQVSTRDVDYLLPCRGLDVWDPIDPVGHKKIIEGSSEATALAAGLAALILACQGAAHGREGIERMRHPSCMKIILDNMIHKKKMKFIQPNMFADALTETQTRTRDGKANSIPDPMKHRMTVVSDHCDGLISTGNLGKKNSLNGNGS